MISLTNLFTIFRRETAAYFNSAIAYIFMIVFVLLNNSLFMTQFFLFGRADMRPFFGSLPFFLAIFLPAVTMRLWAEEKKGNTMELLLTFPMAPHELVLGKYLASLLFYAVTLATTLVIPAMLHFLGHPDFGAIAGAYIGCFLIGAFFLAIGTFISGFARDQIVAFILAMMVCFSLHVIGTDFIATTVDGWVSGLGTLLRNFISSARHFDSFAKGVIDNRDVLYFLIGTTVFLVLNGFWIEGRMRPKMKAIFTSAVVISAGIFFMSNWLIASVPLGRFDLTDGQIYTIAPATKKILNELKAPVNVKFYISPADKMPTGMKTLEQDVRDKLDEFRVASKGLFQYKIFYMEAANVTEENKQGAESLEQQLFAKGIQPFQVQSIQTDEVGVRLVYSALSIAYKEKPEEIIPRIIPDNIFELEYLLASRIYRMMLPLVPKMALVAPYEEKEVEPELKSVLSQLGGKVPEAYREDEYELLPRALNYAGYEVSRIKLNEKEPIPEGIKTLAVVEPKELNDRQRYEINRFLRGGGSVFLAVQNYQYRYSARGRQLEIETEEIKPEINSLLANWGFEVDPQILADEQHDVVNLSGAARLGPYELSVPVKIPIQILVTQPGMNPAVSVTSRLSPIFYLWGTAVRVNEEKVRANQLKITPLLYSSLRSWTVPFQAGMLTAEQLRPDKTTKDRAPFLLAVLVQGEFPDVFQGKPVPAWPQPETAGPEAKSVESTTPIEIKPAPGKLILMGAATPFRKNLLRSGGHLNFFLNSVDALTLGDELVTIRSKQPIDRSIGRVSATVKVVWRSLVTLVMPILVALIGIVRMFLRRQAKQNYLRVLSLAA